MRIHLTIGRGLIFVVALAIIAGAPAAQATHYKLFILTGQSNSLGTTNAGEADASPGTDAADTRVPFFWSNWANETTPLGDSTNQFTNLMYQQGGYYTGSATHWGPEINFGRTLYRAGVTNVAIIKCSRGGGGNSYWLKSSADHHMYTKVVDTVTQACNVLTSGGHTFEIAGLLYLQGESDSTAEAAEAGTRFQTLVDNMRVDLPNASSMFGMIGGIAAAGATRDTVRTNQKAIGDSSSYIDYFSNLDLQTWTASDNLHFNKAAKLRIGERYAQAFFSAGTVSRHYGKLVFIGDSITQGGNGDHPGYRYTVFKNLATKGVPINAATGYKFTGSVTGPYLNSVLTTPDVNGQAFENVHDGHWGWRVSWEVARVALPANRYNVSNLGTGTLLNWTGQSTTYVTANAGTLTYTGTTYIPDTASILIGINDLADGVAATQVRDDIGTMIDQLRAANPNVRIFLNKTLHTNQGATRDQQVNDLHALLPALVTTKNAASATSPVWLVDADTGFAPVTMTYDNIHPNATGEAYIGDRIAAALGVIETPMPSAAVAPPPITESGSSSFAYRFEGNEIWNGSAFVNGWGQLGTLTKSVVDATDIKVVNPSGAANSLGSSGTSAHPNGWDAIRSGSWTFEVRLKFNANANGFILWLGTGTQRILVEAHGDRTQDYGNNAFNISHNNLDNAFHVFRIAHDATNAKYHVWRDGTRLTQVAGVAYDQAATDSRIILGDYTSGTFGNNFDVTIDYVRYDGTGAYLPTTADADTDGMPDSWEFAHWNTGGTYTDMAAAVTGASPTADDDGDGTNNLSEYLANTDPRDPGSVFRLDSIQPPSSPGSGFAIGLAYSSPQRWYSLYRGTNMTSLNSWTPVVGPVVGTDGALYLEDPSPVNGVAFYRVDVSLLP